MKKIIVLNKINILLISLVSLSSFNCFASESCTAQAGSISVSPGNIILQRDTPVGSAITGEISGAMTAVYTCTGTGGEGMIGGVKSTMTFSGMTDAGVRIYETNLPGIGVTLGALGQNTTPGAGPSGYFNWVGKGGTYSGEDYTATGGWYNANNQQMLYFNSQPTIKFYKIGDAKSGIVSGAMGAIIMGFGPGNAGPYDSRWGPDIPVVMNAGTVTVLACSITTPKLTFPLGTISLSEFGTTVGYTSNETSTQNLGLDCDADANINVELVGTQDPDVSEKSVLALNGQGDASTAAGLGVQLLYGGTPLEIDKNIVMKKSAGGQELLPITARYYQTKTKVTSGDASTSATLSITYQ